ncbi:hypothetical protein [Desulfofundulus sp.]|uniref:hypothetical protein n=1 Tax=Desulfofundulus sp. TaxID=2282750 RepID=UPI003C735534
MLNPCRDDGSSFILTFDACPHVLLTNQSVEMKPLGNAFWGYRFLAAARHRHILLLANKELAEQPLDELVQALRSRDNQVTRGSLTGLTGPVDADCDLLFIAGRSHEVKKAVNNLPPSFKGKLIIWYLQ